MTAPTTTTPQPLRHEMYVPGYAAAKLGLAALGLLLLGLSLHKFGPLAHLAVAGGSVRAQAVRIIQTDMSGQETVHATDASVLSAVKAIEIARDHTSAFWLVYRFSAGGKDIEVRSPLGQRGKPLQPLRDADGLPSTSLVWYNRAHPTRIVLPLQLGTWFMPGILALFGALGTFMGLLLWWNARRPIEMPDLSHSHAEAAP